MNYKSERIRRLEEEAKRERIRHALRILAGILAGVVVVALFMIDYANTARIVDGMKKREADTMAQCLTDWKAGHNGGCRWEVKTDRTGTPYTVEAVATPPESPKK